MGLLRGRVICLNVHLKYIFLTEINAFLSLIILDVFTLQQKLIKCRMLF